jgi:hypothetical protein
MLDCIIHIYIAYTVEKGDAGIGQVGQYPVCVAGNSGWWITGQEWLWVHWD